MFSENISEKTVSPQKYGYVWLKLLRTEKTNINKSRCCFFLVNIKTTVAKMDWVMRNRKSHPVLLSSVLPSSLAYGRQRRVTGHSLGGGPLRRSSKTNHQWEVKLLQCHFDNPRWRRHTSSAKFCDWTLTKTEMAPNSSVGVRVSRHGWTSWINHTSMTGRVQSQKALRNNRVGSSFILADCWPHGWGSWALRSAGCCERNTELCIWEGRGRLAAGSNSTPSSFTSFPIHRQIDEGI